jgi:hypothetical protein
VEPLPELSVKLAYKFYDVQAEFNGALQQRPMLSRHRGLLNLNYDRRRWMLNITLHYFGPQRMPGNGLHNADHTGGHAGAVPAEYVRGEWSPGYFHLNSQLNVRLGKNLDWEMYVGGENLTNFIMPNAIIAADQPFSQWFDTSMAWGPITGAVGYLGFRFRVPE